MEGHMLIIIVSALPYRYRGYPGALYPQPSQKGRKEQNHIFMDYL